MNVYPGTGNSSAVYYFKLPMSHYVHIPDRDEPLDEFLDSMSVRTDAGIGISGMASEEGFGSPSFSVEDYLDYCAYDAMEE